MKSFQIDFSEDAEQKIEEAIRVLLQMFKSRIPMMFVGKLVAFLFWFWDNRGKITVWKIVDGKKKRIVI